MRAGAVVSVVLAKAGAVVSVVLAEAGARDCAARLVPFVARELLAGTDELARVETLAMGLDNVIPELKSLVLIVILRDSDTGIWVIKGSRWVWVIVSIDVEVSFKAFGVVMAV